MTAIDYSDLCPKVEKLWHDELSNSQIAEKLKVSIWTVKRALNRLGLPTRRKKKREQPNVKLPPETSYNKPELVYFDIKLQVMVKRFPAGVADGYYHFHRLPCPKPEPEKR